MPVLDKKWLQDTRYYAKGSISGSTILDFNQGSYQAAKATGNFGGFILHNLPNGKGLILELEGGGDWTATWDGLFIVGTMPALQTNWGKDCIGLWRHGAMVFAQHLNAHKWAPPGDVAAWFLRDYTEVGGQWTDYSLNANHVPFYDNAYIDSDGVHLDGDGDYGQMVNDAAYIFGTGEFVFSAWVYADSFAQADYPTIVSGHRSDSATRWIFCVQKETDTTAKGVIYGGLQLHAANTAFNTNEWHHLAATRNGTTIKFYLDGEEDGSWTNSGVFDFHTSYPPRIGRQAKPEITPPYYDRYWDGVIDDIIIGRAGLTQTEIQHIMNTSPGSHA